MSTIRTIPPEPSDPSPTTNRPSTPPSHPSTPTTVATLTPNGHHRATVTPIPLRPFTHRRPPNPHTPDGVVEMEMQGPHTWPEVKRSWWKRVWSWLKGWRFR
ncbi:hypothetical protein KCU81_g2063, partial [Aureobasidium melanogenum]|uniref:Uncharacterized protein n=1 Tax=Aureobasidium melanogenum (strain CBS 110374) TaxID=1043003 RepID=A0A074WIF0_AURM1